MKNYKELLQEDPTEALTEGYTWDIVSQFAADGKSDKFILYYDEVADTYMLKQKGFKGDGVILTSKQWKELKNAMKVYYKI